MQDNKNDKFTVFLGITLDSQSIGMIDYDSICVRGKRHTKFIHFHEGKMVCFR